jgi:hypothetical protein
MYCYATLATTLFVNPITVVPKGHNFHNRRSATCGIGGIGAHHNLYPKGRTDVAQTLVNKPSSTNHRHCEERSDEAIHEAKKLLDCYATPPAPHFQFSIK